jgi:glycosyltransferase involved in cell wall biosynthesis
MSARQIPQVSIYHSILWSKYKGVVFSEVYSQSNDRGVETSFIQVAETEVQRVGLTGIDLSYHRYPYRLLFHGAYENVPLYRRVIALARDVIKNRSDLIVLPNYDRIEYWVMLGLCMLLRRKRAVICDSTGHDSARQPWKEVAKRVFFRHCDGYFCYGIRSKQYLLSYGVDEVKIKYRRQAAALPHEYHSQRICAYYQNAPLASSAAPSFLYIGRFSKEKGLFDLLDAFHDLRKKLPASTLNLVGDGPLKSSLAERVAALGLGSSVTFRGSMNLEKIAPFLLASSALVLPSRHEPWGLVVNEALSYGCPVVVSDVCGCVPELVRDGVTGFSFPVGNVAALSQAMLAAVALSADRPSVAKRCLDVIAAYSPQNSASQMLDGCIQIIAAA